MTKPLNFFAEDKYGKPGPVAESNVVSFDDMKRRHDAQNGDVSATVKGIVEANRRVDREPLNYRKALGALLVAATLGAGVAHVFGGGESTEPQSVKLYTVEQGDTAWGIAEKVDPNSDPRELTDELMEQGNNDGQPGLQTGETIYVPDLTQK